MKTITATEAKNKLGAVMDSALVEPVMIEIQKKAKNQSQPKATMKQQIVRTHLYFKQNSQDGVNQWSVSLPPNA